MPTHHPRIAVTCDPDLARALRETSDVVAPGAPAATRLRALALAGANAALAAAGNRDAAQPATQDWLVGRFGARASTARLADVLPRLGPYDPEDPTPGTDALRADRDQS